MGLQTHLGGFVCASTSGASARPRRRAGAGGAAGGDASELEEVRLPPSASAERVSGRQPAEPAHSDVPAEKKTKTPMAFKNKN
ncbi:hypothetical protein EVAR_101794_1 [Eumeta japonica]|uniref:Uncharacterized protein n=1 Tax=Eumeta variegata TaxID=151549 RepID=A0A4C1SMP4_EUMVA|nr:hypothetical protein EVAR_101794_1 [Eumeta japonica]